MVFGMEIALTQSFAEVLASTRTPAMFIKGVCLDQLVMVYVYFLECLSLIEEEFQMEEFMTTVDGRRRERKSSGGAAPLGISRSDG